MRSKDRFSRLRPAIVDSKHGERAMFKLIARLAMLRWAWRLLRRR